MKVMLAVSLVVSVVVAGCAAGFTTVSTGQWQTVPEAEREAIDRTTGAELTRAQTELKAAQAALVAAQKAATVPATHHAPTAAPGVIADDAAVSDFRRMRAEAIATVETAKAEWLRASVAWRTERLAAATAWVALVQAERELIRASAVDRRSSDSDFNLGSFRGQLATAQSTWYYASTRTDEARIALHHAGTDLASAKENVAMLVRGGLPPVEGVPAPLRLVGTFANPNEIRPRGMELRTADARTCHAAARWCGLHRTVLGQRMVNSDTSYLVLPKSRDR